MHNELAQAIALVAHGNQFLREVPSEPAPELYNSNSTFAYVKVLRFMNADQFPFASGSKLATAENKTGPWFEDLRKRGAKRMLIHVARGRWQIQVDLERQFELWTAIWDTPGLREKGWLVTYQRHALEKPIAVPPSSLDVPERRLANAIQGNKDFASEALAMGEGDPAGISFFIKMFDKALGFATSDDPKPSYPDMLPGSGYDLRSRRLVAMASNAWVFGGMSWWNDIWFDDSSLRDKHSQLIDELYSAVVEGLVAGVNSFENL